MLNMNVSPQTLNSGSSYETSGRKHLIQEKIGGTGYEHNMQSKNRVFNIMDTGLTTNKNSSNTFNDSFATHFDYQDVSSLSGRMSLANQGGGEGLAEGKSSTLSLNEILDDVNRINEKSYDDNCAASLQFANENLNDYDVDGTNESTDMVRSVEVENDNVAKKLPNFHCDYSEHSLTTMSQINFRTVELDNNFSAHHTRCLPRKSRSVNSGLMIKCNDTTSLNDRSKNILSKIASKNIHAAKHLHTDSALIDDSSFSDSISVMNTVPRDRSFILDQNKCNGALKASQRAGFDEDGNNTVKKRPTKNLFNNESAKWKNIFPLSCTKTQEEKDEGYISNKNSEGSYEIAANISSASH
ncbi:hypothetical protein HELRODRAFT_163886 [Helobdella robusta]|uniref:Uncharacterized protein n=1 Tax=Helobdella robusta TaxID=6412 RepID=T1EUL0_HELRO|nr:hypothetical protein HELRODRAFT_163886 [Helobdella robusta]ESN96770.1 hypothetical protein HELRODRAFT_163886 [Helobdella robusta]